MTTQDPNPRPSVSRRVFTKEYVRSSLRVLQATREDEKKAHAGWALLPKLFQIWDLDGNGTLDQRELFTGLGRYCRLKGIRVDEQKVMEILTEVDINHDRQLDSREFSIFLARFADCIQVDIFDLAYAMVEQLTNRPAPPPQPQYNKPEPEQEHYHHAQEPVAPTPKRGPLLAALWASLKSEV